MYCFNAGVIDMNPFVSPSFSCPSSIFMARTTFFVTSIHRLFPLHYCCTSFSLLPSSLSSVLSSFSRCWSVSVLRADINECERLPQPCAHQCINTPGSYKCTCPPGRHLLGDGKSCAGLERLPSYESYSYGYQASQTSPERSSYPRLYHNVASQSFHSYAASTRGRYRGRSSRQARRGSLPCPQGFEFRGGSCFGNYGDEAQLR